MSRSRKKASSQQRLLWLLVPGLIGLFLFFATHPDVFLKTSGEKEWPGGRKLLESKESLYNNIYILSQGDYISMTFGYNRRIYTESIFNTHDDRDLPVVYTRYMTASLIYPGKIHSILEIGFGGGRTAWYLHRALPDVSITTVELDPGVVTLAKKYFGIREEPNFKIMTEDGRKFLSHSQQHYDIILIDAYRGPFVPFHLLTKEFYQLVKDHLADGGVVAQNVEPTTMLFDSAVMTMHSTFPQLDFYVADGNVVTIGYPGDRLGTDVLKQRAGERQSKLHLHYDLTQMLARQRPFAPGNGNIDSNAKILTDDFAPVESLKAIEAHNRKWQDP